MKVPKRPYRMAMRAEKATATRALIVEAAGSLLRERFLDDVTLDSIAERAGVTVRTVLRRFGTRDLLIDAARADLQQRVIDQRNTAPIGNIPGAVATLFDHYEEYGDYVIRNLAQEDHVPRVHESVESGRRGHRQWVERTFAPRGEEAINAVIAAADVYTWKLLRRDKKLDRAEAEAVVSRLISGVIERR
ncbi:MAG: TetR/AcrR family transcriptional regulator [Candidatus Dormibacteraceae bacterium]